MGEDMDGARLDAHTLYRTVLLAAGLLVLGLLFRELVTLLVAILITILISIPIAAAATRLERYRIPRPLGALLAELGLVLAFLGVFAAIMPTFVDQVNEFIDDVPGIVDDLEREVADITDREPGEVGDELQERLEGVVDDPGQLVGPVAAIGVGLAGFLAAAVLCLITAYYVAVRPEPLIRGALSLFPPERRDWALAVGERVRASWIGWMKGALVDMFLNGLLIYLGLMLIGLDFPLVWGVLAGLFTVVPYFGPIAASIPPILFAGDGPDRAAAPGADRRRGRGRRAAAGHHRPVRRRPGPGADGGPRGRDLGETPEHRGPGLHGGGRATVDHGARTGARAGTRERSGVAVAAAVPH
ncbi:MAG: putative permease [Solirubrobacterales bacterium]|nr:putative permease [Solirubrobacterales bacterium]